MTMNSRSAEERIIGSLLLSPDVYDDVVDIINAQDFTDMFCSKMFVKIVNAISLNQPVEVLTIAEHHEDTAKLVGIVRRTPTYANAKHFAQIIKQASVDRQLQLAAQKTLQLVEQKDDDRLNKVQQLFLSIAEHRAQEPMLISEFSANVLDNLQSRIDSKNQLSGLGSGFADLDKLTCGFGNGDLIILAARPSMGKTLLALNIAEHIAIKQNLPVAIFSLEMSKESLCERMVSSQARVDAEKIKLGNVTEPEQEKITAALTTLSKAKILIDDHSPLTTHELRAKCRRIKRKHGLSLIVVDYLTLMHGEGENETRRIGNISRDLKLIAKELNVPVIAISQLNRNLESRNNKRPTMSDLRQSGEIEQDADMILFIYRDEVYDKESPFKNVAEIILAKNRNGAIGDLQLTFRGDICRFDNYNGAPIVPIKKTTEKTWQHGFSYKGACDE